MSSRPPSYNHAPRRAPGLRAAVAAVALLGVVGPAGAAAQEADPWLMAGRDPAHTATADAPAPPYREVWTIDVGLGGPLAGPAVARDVVVGGTERGGVGLDPASGEPRWEASRAEGPAGPPAVAGDLVVHTSGSGSATAVVARTLTDGREVWRAFVDSEVGSGLVAADGLVYAATAAGELFALDAATGGDPEWRFATPGPAVPASAPASADGRAVVATSDGMVRALNLDGGGEAWTADVRAAVSARQVPAASAPFVVADRLHLYALEPEGGEERWTFLLADLAELPGGRRNTLSPASPAVLGGAAVIGDTSGTLSAIDLASGRRVWRRDLGSGPLGPVAASGDLLYATTLGSGGSVTALEHDPSGTLIDEPSPTTVFPLRAVLNFALAALGLGLVAFGLSRLALRRGPAS